MPVQYEFTYKEVSGGNENILEATKPKLFYYNGIPSIVLNSFNNAPSTTYYLHRVSSSGVDIGDITAEPFTTYPLCTPFELSTTDGLTELTTTTTADTSTAASTTVAVADRSVIMNNVTRIGELREINNPFVDFTNLVCWSDTDLAFEPSSGDFIMFSKENQANLGSLLGYVAEVEFFNNSINKAELFSIGAEVSESSK